MDKSRNILAWLGQREEKQTLNDALVHVEKSLTCVKELKNSIEAFARDDQAGKDKAITSLKQAEHEGDEIRKKMMEELSRGMLMPPDREDLLFLNESLNDIADNAKDAGRLLEFLKEPLLPELNHELLNNSITAVRAAEKLEQAISSLIDNDVKNVLENCAQIETLEEEGDDRKRELLGYLLKSSLIGPSLLIVYEIIDTLEEVIDCIDRSGDLVRTLAIKAR